MSQHTITISQQASDYLAALNAEATAAQGKWLAALTAILRNAAIDISGPISTVQLDGGTLTVTTVDG